jgi:hypothetical protein
VSEVHWARWSKFVYLGGIEGAGNDILGSTAAYGRITIRTEQDKSGDERPTLVVGGLALVGAENLDGGETLDAILSSKRLVLVGIEGTKLDDSLDAYDGVTRGDATTSRDSVRYLQSSGSLGPLRLEILAMTACSNE